MEKYRFIYFTGEATILEPKNGRGSRELHCVNAIFHPNANYEYDEQLDLQVETQEQMNTIKSIVSHGNQTTAWL